MTASSTVPTIRTDGTTATGRPALPLASTDLLPGYKIIRSVGLVRGNTVRTRHVGHDIVAGIKSLLGGEIGEYTKVMAEAREEAIDRMQHQAMTLGANGVTAVRITTSTVMAGAAEIVAYGTAVVVEKVN
jgi:uncharacterized protein YbjQ (UPF0145 family)